MSDRCASKEKQQIFCKLITVVVSTCLSRRNERNSGRDGDLLLSFNDPVSLRYSFLT